MNMGDELGTAAVQITTNTAQTAVSTVANLIDQILKMMSSQREHKARMAQIEQKSGTDISELKPGSTKIKDLIKNARKNGDSIVTSENGISRSDANALTRIAKEYGVPIAFTNTDGNDNIYAHVRSSDSPVFKQMFTDMMREKLQTKPQDLGNFKVQEWEIPFITSELNNFDLNAQFGKTKGGEHFCMYDKVDEKAILIARGEFVKKYKEVNKDFSVDRDEEDFYTLKDIRSGKEISFDDSKKSCKELTDDIQKIFGYDANKSAIAAAKFGEENLEGEIKKNYFSNPQNQARSVTTNIVFEDDDVYTSQYTCLRIVPKQDDKTRVVFASQDGKFAVISPDMKYSEMSDEFKSQLNITDKKELNSLINKAEKTILYYSKREDAARYVSEYNFNKMDFNMSDSETVSGMKREVNGHIFTRTLPLDSLSLNIERNGKNEFKVKSNAVHIEADENNKLSKNIEERSISSSFSDKKKAIHELEQMFVTQGVPESVAKRAAHDAFAKAESQESERIVSIEEVRTGTAAHYNNNISVTVDVYSNGSATTVDVLNPDKAKKQISEAFNVSDNEASVIYENVSDRLTDKQLSILKERDFVNCEDWTVGEASFVIEKIAQNNWTVPSDMDPSTFQIDRLKDSSINIEMEKHIPKPVSFADAVDVDFDKVNDVIKMGGR